MQTQGINKLQFAKRLTSFAGPAITREFAKRLTNRLWADRHVRFSKLFSRPACVDDLLEELVIEIATRFRGPLITEPTDQDVSRVVKEAVNRYRRIARYRDHERTIKPQDEPLCYSTTSNNCNDEYFPDPPKWRFRECSDSVSGVGELLSRVVLRPRQMVPDWGGSTHRAILIALEQFRGGYEKTYLGFTSTDGTPEYFSALTDGFETEFKQVAQLLATQHKLANYFSADGRLDICQSFVEMQRNDIGWTTATTTKGEVLDMYSWHCEKGEIRASLDTMARRFQPKSDLREDVERSLRGAGRMIVTFYGLKDFA